MNPVLDDTALEYADKALKEKQWESISEKNKILIALGMGAVAPATHKALGMRMGMGILPKALILGALGYAIPSIINEAIGKNDDERRGFLKSEFDRVSTNPFQKKSSLVRGLPAVGSLFGKAVKFGLKGGADLARGVVSPIKGKTMGETALSIGSKALVGYGAYQGGKYIANKRRKPNYVDYLRNQVLAGNISPEELTASDLESVRKLGMK